jgi:hypothetical protein
MLHAKRDGDQIELTEEQQSLYRSAYKVCMKQIDEMLASDAPAEPRVLDDWEPKGRQAEAIRASLNTQQKSWSGDEFQQGKITNIDANPDFKPVVARGTRGSLGTFQKHSLDPTFSEGKDKVWEGLISGYFSLELEEELRGNPMAEMQAAAVQENLEELLTPEFKLEWLTGVFETGTALWEPIDDVSGFIRALEYVRSDAIDQWVQDEEERVLIAIDCKTKTREFTLAAEHAILYSHRRVGTNYDGRPQIREVAVMIVMKWLFLRLAGLAGEVHGLGIKTIEKDKDITDTGTKVVEAFSKMAAEDNPVFELGAGRKFNWHSPNNGQPDFIPIINLLDQQITKKTSSSGTLLGFGDYGSKALAETKDDEATQTVHHYGLLFCDFVNRAIIARIRRNRPSMPKMKLRFRTSNEATDPERHKRLVAYRGGDMLTWGPADEARLRADEGLPALEVEAEGPQAAGEIGTDADAINREAAASGFNEGQSPGSTEASESGDTRAPESDDIQKSALNGAQVSSMIGVVEAVQGGAIPRESGIRILMRAFQLGREDAVAIVGEVSAPTTPSPAVV